MKKFNELGIKSEVQGFKGDKIRIDRILNREVTVLAYRIEESKYNGKCLHMQIALGDIKHVVFTGSVVLQDMIKRVAPEDFPFKTTIVKEDERFEFT